MDVLRQLGGLFLAAVPTIILVALFYLFLRWSFFGPMERVLAERDSRVAGARRDAKALRAAAEEKRRAYQEALRKTRAEILAEQEAARRAVLGERTEVLRRARSLANREIEAAKKRLDEEIEAARRDLDTSGEQLAEEIARAIVGGQPLKPAPAGEAQ
jgi:F-type H+-transporting ATPase subunit b